jgi:hypothetical protein
MAAVQKLFPHVLEHNSDIWRAQLISNNNILSWRDLIVGLHDREGRQLFNNLLANIPFAAYMLETPPLSNATLDFQFELTAVQALEEDYEPLHRDTFDMVLQSRGNQPRTCIFQSITPDGIPTSTSLITPSDVGDEHVQYVHACKNIATFVRFAHEVQQDVFWNDVAQQLAYRMTQNTPTWVSTEGRGVHWLHLRLADGPKHFQTEAYKYYLGQYWWNQNNTGRDNGITPNGRATSNRRCRNGRNCRFGLNCRYIHDEDDSDIIYIG